MDYSSETMKVRHKWHTYFKCLKKELYSPVFGKITFKNSEVSKTFSDERKLRKIFTSKSTLKQWVKEHL